MVQVSITLDPTVQSLMAHGKSSRHRGWCFTTNNYTDADTTATEEIDCKYLIYGREVGENETPHLQGYVYFKAGKTMSAVKKLLPRSHLEPAVGNSLQNKEYCSKEAVDIFEKGDRPATPKEKGEQEQDKWLAIWEAAKNNKMEEVPAKVRIQNYRSLKQISVDNRPLAGNLDDCCGVWLYGQHGCGKSHVARTTYPDAYIKNPTKWWDHYDGEEVVILEDMDPFNKCLGRDFKIWGDKYAFPAELKGGSFKLIRPKIFIVTSQYHPSEIWEDKKTLGAILDRFQLGHVPGESRRKQKKRTIVFPQFSPSLKKPKLVRSSNLEQHSKWKHHGSHFDSSLSEEETEFREVQTPDQLQA